VLTDIYPCERGADSGVTIDALAGAIRGRRVRPRAPGASIERLPAEVASLARAGDLIVTLGAGSIGRAGAAILAEIARRSGTGGH